LVIIEMDDAVWSKFKKSWALMGVRDHDKLIEMLEEQVKRESDSVIKDSETVLIDDTPEAYVQREIGLEKQRIEKKKQKGKSKQRILRI
jgi:hypothetical protein